MTAEQAGARLFPGYTTWDGLGYEGLIRIAGARQRQGMRIVWRCGHRHDRRKDAQRCAWAEWEARS